MLAYPLPPVQQPRTPARDPWQRSVTSRGGLGTYGSRLASLSQRRRARARPQPPATPGWLTPTSDADLEARVRAQVAGQIDPRVAELTRSINADTTARAGGLRRQYEEMAAALTSYQPTVRDIYQRARVNQAAVGAAAAKVTGAGAGLASELAGKMRAIGAPEAQVVEDAGGLQAAAAGGANAGYMGDTAELGALIARGAEEEKIAAQEPVWARMAGLRAVQDLEEGSRRDLMDRVGEITSQTPGIVAGLLGESRAAEVDKAQLRETYARDRRDFEYGRATDRRDFAEQRRQYDTTLAENRVIRQKEYGL